MGGKRRGVGLDFFVAKKERGRGREEKNTTKPKKNKHARCSNGKNRVTDKPSQAIILGGSRVPVI